MTSENPYTPGVAGIPPVLAGRDEELQQFEDLAERLARGQWVDHETILYGPRGNGKTTLLHMLEARLKKSARVKPISALPWSVDTPELLYRKILGLSVPSQQTETTRLKGNLGVLGTSVGGERETSQVTDTVMGDLEGRCIAAMAESPTLLMVDEAQKLSSASLHAILSLTEASRKDETKFAVILAGTPSLPAHLRKMEVTYLNRAPRRRMERLDVESSKIALFKPLENAGFNIRLNEDERDLLLEQTQCYPYFIQSVGHALWAAAETSATRSVDRESVANARPQWEERVRVMYEDRFHELRFKRLVPYATAVAAAFARFPSTRTGFIDEEDITKVVKEVDATVPAHEVVDELESLGYVWPAKGAGHLYEPGIPSLMDHMLGIARDREDQKRARSLEDDIDLEP